MSVEIPDEPERPEQPAHGEDAARAEGPLAEDGGRSEAAVTADGSTPAPDAADGGRRWRRDRRDTPRRKAPWWELPALVVIAILIAILVKSFVVQPFYIPSGSMEHTLHGSNGKNDRILVNKVIYDFRDPEPGDIVVFNAPPGWDDEPGTTPPSNPILRAVRGFGQLVGFVPPDGEVLVKRVIASGGQTVYGDAAGNVYICTKDCAFNPTTATTPPDSYRKLDEPYVFRDVPTDGDNGHAKFGPVTIPSGRLWVMGDHRDNSEDSRFHCSADGQSADSAIADCQTFVSQATVPNADVIGKAFVVAWPPSDWRTLGTPPTFENAAAAAVSPSALPFVALVPLFLLRRRRRR